MDELIGSLVGGTGIDRAAAEKAVGIVLDFSSKEGPADKVRAPSAKLPGADALMQCNGPPVTAVTSRARTALGAV